MTKTIYILLIIILSLMPVTGFSQQANADFDMSSYYNEISHVKGSYKFIIANMGKAKTERTKQAMNRRYETLLNSGPRLVSLYNQSPDKAVFELIVEVQKNTKLHLYKSINGDKFVEYTEQELRTFQELDLASKNGVLLLTDNRSKYVKYFKRFAAEFKQAFPAFTAAQAVIAASDLEHNPVAIEQFLEQFKDPLLMTSSFGVFIGGSHLAQAGLNSKFIKNNVGSVSPGLAGNLGLGAGMFVSAIYTEIWNDVKSGVIHQCITDFETSKELSNKKNGFKQKLEDINAKIKSLKSIDGEFEKRIANNLVPANELKGFKDQLVVIKKELAKAKLDKKVLNGEIEPTEDQINAQKERHLEKQNEACFLANQKWGEKDKYINYTPDVLSLIGASYLNHKAIGYGVQIFDKATFGKYVPGIRAAQAAGRLNPFSGFALMVGNFVVFMKIHHKIMPYFTRPWNHNNFNYLGWSLSQDLKNDKAAEHSKYIRTYKTNKKQVKWLGDNLTNIEHYLHPEGLKQCIANAKKITAKRALKFANPLTIAHELRARKARAEHCQQYYNPALIIQNDYAFNKERNRLRMDSFSTKQASWFQYLGKISQRSSDAKVIYNEMLRLKAEFVPTPDQKYPKELNMEYFAQNFQADKDSYPQRLNNIDFRNMAEYYIYQMACGPGSDTPAGFGTKVHNPFENLADIDFIKTPFGSSLEFVPPKVTTTDRSICDTKRFINTQQSMIYSNKVADINPEDLNGVFNSYWIDKTKRNRSYQTGIKEQFEYRSLAEYVFDHLDPNFVGNILSDEIPENHNEHAYSWSTQVVDTLNNVWTKYEDAYVHLLKEDLIPLLIKTPAKGSITSFTHQFSNAYKSFLRALDLKPIIPETEKRLIDRIDLLTATVKKFGRNTPLFEQSAMMLKQILSQEFSDHRKYIRTWDNSQNLTKRQVQIGNDLIRHIKNLQSSLFMLDHEGFYYSQHALTEVQKDNCDSRLISDYQNKLRLKYSSIKIISCNFDKAKASDLQTAVNVIERMDELVDMQTLTIAKEINDYYKMMNKLLGIIGQFN